MTAHHEDPNTQQATSASTDPDPIGPVQVPQRSRIGARAMALVGTASVAAMAVHVVVEGCTTHTSISQHQ